MRALTTDARRPRVGCGTLGVATVLLVSSACTPLIGSTVADAGPSDTVGVDAPSTDAPSVCPIPRDGPPGSIDLTRTTLGEHYPELARFIPHGATLAAGGGYYVYGFSYGCEVRGVPNASVARFASDGSLDTAFGEGGRVCVSFSDGRSDSGSVFLGAAQDARGRLVLAGYRSFPSHAEGLALRLTADGARDGSFGPRGMRLLGEDDGFASGVALYDVVAEADGAVFVGGAANQFVESDYGVVLRLRDDGSLDPSFGADTGPVDREAQMYSALVRAGDGYAAAGWGRVGLPARVLRIDHDGRRVAGFGRNGVATHVGLPMLVRGAVRTPDGGFVVGGGLIGVPQQNSLALQRFDRDGVPDLSFGVRGTAASGSGWDVGYLFHPVMAGQCDGRLLVGSHKGGLMVVERWLPNGAIDATFGVGGERSIGAVGAMRAVLVDPTDDTITAVGTPNYGGSDALGWTMAFWRLRP